VYVTAGVYEYSGLFYYYLLGEDTANNRQGDRHARFGHAFYY